MREDASKCGKKTHAERSSFRWGLSPSDGNRNQQAIATRSQSRRGLPPSDDDPMVPRFEPPPRPSQSLWDVPPQLAKLLKKFAPPPADPLQCNAWSLHRFRIIRSRHPLARRPAREVGSHLRTTMLQTPPPQPSAPSHRSTKRLLIRRSHP